MGADERDGLNAFGHQVQAKTEDLAVFFTQGTGYVAGLEGTFDGVVSQRTSTGSVLGDSGVTPLAAKSNYSGSNDPFAELIAEAKYNNGFVEKIHDALLDGTGVNGVYTAPYAAVNRALTHAGFSLSDEDIPLDEDKDRLEEIENEAAKAEIEAELEDIIDGAMEGNDRYEPHQTLGIAIYEYANAAGEEDPDRRALIAEVMIEMGIHTQADLDPDAEGNYLNEQAATMLVTQGLLLLPESEQGALVDDLTSARVDGQPALNLLVDALDLDESGFILSNQTVGPSHDGYSHANQPYRRQQLLDQLLGSTIESDGTISAGGQQLTNYVLDTYPDLVAESDDSRWVGGVSGFDDLPPQNLRSTLATALAAPNYGLDDDQYAAAVRIDEIDAQLANPDQLTDAEFNELWLERRVRVSELVDHDEDATEFVNQAMIGGVPAADAGRIAISAVDEDSTNDRVRRLRLVYDTDALGNPVSPDQVENLDVPDEVKQSLAVELSVLQTVQEARFLEGSPQVDLPLDDDQIGLVSSYGEYAAWLHNFGNGWALGHEEALRQIAAGEASVFHDIPEGLQELAIELTKPENAIIFELLPGAAGNDTFMGPGGEYQSAGASDFHITREDTQALVVQMILTARLGPLYDEINPPDDDGNRPANLHEDQIEAWLDANKGNPNVPPTIIDLVETGRQFGLGEDTFGWEEFGELIGWIGLAAAVTATVVYSGGAAAPLWVKAGLIGLAALEVYAFIEADDPLNVAIAATGGLGDIFTAARLIRRGQRIVNLGDASSQITLKNTTDELVEIARRSTNADLRALAGEADQLSSREFMDRYAAILAVNEDKIARELLSDGRSAAEVVTILDELDLPPPTVGTRGITATDADLRLIDDPTRKPLTRPRPDGVGREVWVPNANGGGEWVNLINSRNVENGRYKTARFDENGFIELDSHFDTAIDDVVSDAVLHGGKDGPHFAAANQKLYEAILEDPTLVNRIGLDDAQLAHIWPKPDGTFRTTSPADLTWHHHQDLGRLQLVDRVGPHQVNHTGGMRIWGGGRSG